MADVLVKPAFQSAVADSGDATKLGPTAWNAARLFSGGSDGEVVARDSASPTGASWIPPVDLSGYALLAHTHAGVYEPVITALALGQGGTSPFGAAGTVLIGGAVPSWSATPTLTDLTLAGVLKSGNGITRFSTNANGTYLHAQDGGGYFILSNGRVFVNSADLALGSGGTPDVVIARDAASTLALRNGTNAQRLNLGQGNTALAAGRLAMGRDAAAAFAPGAGYGLVRWETGTNAGTLKLVAYAGTSTTGVTVIDNVGGGN